MKSLRKSPIQHNTLQKTKNKTEYQPFKTRQKQHIKNKLITGDKFT